MTIFSIEVKTLPVNLSGTILKYTEMSVIKISNVFFKHVLHWDVFLKGVGLPTKVTLKGCPVSLGIKQISFFVYVLSETLHRTTSQ